jgi:hypothetical protein
MQTIKIYKGVFKAQSSELSGLFKFNFDKEGSLTKADFVPSPNWKQIVNNKNVDLYKRKFKGLKDPESLLNRFEGIQPDGVYQI